MNHDRIKDEAQKANRAAYMATYMKVRRDKKKKRTGSTTMAERVRDQAEAAGDTAEVQRLDELAGGLPPGSLQVPPAPTWVCSTCGKVEIPGWAQRCGKCGSERATVTA